MRPEGEQSLDSKQGEVIYRRKLALQQSHEGQAIVPEAHTKQEILAVMEERMAQTRRDIKTITATGIPISPYIELGAERCQRALILENEFSAAGFALDISLICSGMHLSSQSAFERLINKFGLLTVLWKADVLEQEHGILEEEFDIPMWRRALSGFQPIRIVVNRKLRIRVNSLNRNPSAILAQLAGGNIQVLAKKTNPRKLYCVFSGPFLRFCNRLSGR